MNSVKSFFQSLFKALCKEEYCTIDVWIISVIFLNSFHWDGWGVSLSIISYFLWSICHAELKVRGHI